MSRNSRASDEREIDRVLRLKRKETEIKACIPCRRRKVRCDKGSPCKTCQKRGHPLICTYAPGHQSPATRRIPYGQALSTARHSANPEEAPDLSLQGLGSYTCGRQQERTSMQSPRRTPLSASAMQEESAQDYIFSGDNSIASIVRSQAQRSNDTLKMNLEPVLGLQNTFSSYPFMDQKLSQNKWAMLLEILPQRDEVLKFFHVYKTSNYLFTPVLVDMDQFELDIYSYLNALAAGELQGSSQTSDRWLSGKSLGFISLILAVLAAGAHFSDIENPERASLCQDFEQRSFQALRLANFLFRPSADIVQTLLLLGSTLQNNGQSDAAWAMLGTTVRLAQIQGFHTEKGMAHLSERMKSTARKCWSNVVWQDALLSLCHGRPPVTSRYTSTELAGDNLSYTDITDYICRLGLKIVDAGEPDARDAIPSIAALGGLDNAYSRAQPHLRSRENCKTFHQHLEHFQALSTVPLRSWPMVHTALISTLLLCIWEETRSDPECRDLQQKVIEVFATAAPTSVSASQSWQWLSEGHSRALVALRNAFCDESGLRASTDQEHVDARRVVTDTQSHDEVNFDSPNDIPPFNIPSQLHDASDYSTIPSGSLTSEELDLLYNSPLSYIDSILNGQ
ncbi:hypothetical protein PENARI_c009G05443 [Penicillium arizonense]|uniref:Zn(2)-C6 fungal-type domain-containing protein n=1 Tax=Penicillium arizonense TaxID=1835702 RepID=A0A1F5LIB0_PENAI|nr:hypothetical protein PENARI_c009G05443 [Penicillium arizonense]OGE52760.1 hypothetical protein PENARI_c009G05443 [Penicillium arizonense]